ncbi:hypothetical protein [Sinimarinibacterium flocculans]|uniref:hypothetical protein n=1 Tax=Sinimarinibacterium flocculans TaxID=985250 RepID=UPI0024925130|nr:hypothetical protein [Sinimarinibacterium flocculans]
MKKKSTVTPLDLVAKPKHKSVKHKGKPKSWSGVVKRAEDGKKTPNAQVVDNQQRTFRTARKKYQAKHGKKPWRSAGKKQRRDVGKLIVVGRGLMSARADNRDDFLKRIGFPSYVKVLQKKPYAVKRNGLPPRPLVSPQIPKGVLRTLPRHSKSASEYLEEDVHV